MSYYLKTSLRRHHKLLIYPALLCLFITCRDNLKEPTNTGVKYSGTQNYLFNLLDNYKTDYFAATQPEQKANIQNRYLGKMEHFLVDSLGRYIDSMTVVVDTVIQEGWLVTTQFHARDIEFKYGMTFQDSMPPKFDSLYQFMKGLSPGKTVTVNFVHLGTGELNKLDDERTRTMKIFAYPEPLNQ